MNYFAYGSNMNWSDLDKWCEKKEHDPIDRSTHTETGVIKGYRLAFNHLSKSRGGGALNIVKSTADEVCGVLFTLSENDFKKIIEKEGPKYKLHSVNVHLNRGKIVVAKIFQAENIKEFHAPTEEYLGIVLAGAEQFHLGENCLNKIRSAAQEAKKLENPIPIF